MNITIKYLKYFVAASKNSSFSKAAEELHVSVSSVIAAVTRLEEEFGFDLFIRQPAKGLLLTPSGKRALVHANSILDQIQLFSNEIAGINTTLKGEISIGCFTTFAPYFLPPIIARLKSAHPNLSFNVYETDLQNIQKLLVEGEIDVMLGYNEPGLYPEIEYESLRKIHPHALISSNNPLAQKPSVTLEDLAQQAMVLFDMPTSRNYILSYFDSIGTVPNVVLTSKSVNGVREYVGEGLGFSILHLRNPADLTFGNKQVLYKPISNKLSEPEIIIGFLKNNRGIQSLKVSAFADECRKLFRSSDVSKYFVQ